MWVEGNESPCGEKGTWTSIGIFKPSSTTSSHIRTSSPSSPVELLEKTRSSSPSIVAIWTSLRAISGFTGPHGPSALLASLLTLGYLHCGTMPHDSLDWLQSKTSIIYHKVAWPVIMGITSPGLGVGPQNAIC